MHSESLLPRPVGRAYQTFGVEDPAHRARAARRLQEAQPAYEGGLPHPETGWLHTFADRQACVDVEREATARAAARIQAAREASRQLQAKTAVAPTSALLGAAAAMAAAERRYVEARAETQEDDANGANCQAPSSSEAATGIFPEPLRASNPGIDDDGPSWLQKLVSNELESQDAQQRAQAFAAEEQEMARSFASELDAARLERASAVNIAQHLEAKAREEEQVAASALQLISDFDKQQRAQRGLQEEFEASMLNVAQQMTADRESAQTLAQSELADAELRLAAAHRLVEEATQEKQLQISSAETQVRDAEQRLQDAVECATASARDAQEAIAFIRVERLRREEAEQMAADAWEHLASARAAFPVQLEEVRREAAERVARAEQVEHAALAEDVAARALWTEAQAFAARLAQDQSTADQQKGKNARAAFEAGIRVAEDKAARAEQEERVAQRTALLARESARFAKEEQIAAQTKASAALAEMQVLRDEAQKAELVARDRAATQLAAMRADADQQARILEQQAITEHRRSLQTKQQADAAIVAAKQAAAREHDQLVRMAQKAEQHKAQALAELEMADRRAAEANVRAAAAQRAEMQCKEEVKLEQEQCLQEHRAAKSVYDKAMKADAAKNAAIKAAASERDDLVRMARTAEQQKARAVAEMEVADRRAAEANVRATAAQRAEMQCIREVKLEQEHSLQEYQVAKSAFDAATKDTALLQEMLATAERDREVAVQEFKFADERFRVARSSVLLEENCAVKAIEQAEREKARRNESDRLMLQAADRAAAAKLDYDKSIADMAAAHERQQASVLSKVRVLGEEASAAKEMKAEAQQTADDAIQRAVRENAKLSQILRFEESAAHELVAARDAEVATARRALKAAAEDARRQLEQHEAEEALALATAVEESAAARAKVAEEVIAARDAEVVSARRVHKAMAEDARRKLEQHEAEEALVLAAAVEETAAARAEVAEQAARSVARERRLSEDAQAQVEQVRSSALVAWKRAEASEAEVAMERRRGEAALRKAEATNGLLEAASAEAAKRVAARAEAFARAECDAADARAIARATERRAQKAEEAAETAAREVLDERRCCESARNAETVAADKAIAAADELKTHRLRAQAAAEAAEDPLGIRSMMAKLIWAAATPVGAKQVVGLIVEPPL